MSQYLFWINLVTTAVLLADCLITVIKIKAVQEVCAAAERKKIILASIGISRHIITRWKCSASNQYAVFMATNYGTIALFDSRGTELDELFLPQKFDYFTVTNDLLVLSHSGEKTAYPLSEIQRYGTGRPYSFPPKNDLHIRITQKGIFAIISSEIGKKVLRAKQLTINILILSLWIISTATRFICFIIERFV